jgi:dTDP-4-amino-4,6-dideoxygalactose transaminase
MKQRGQPARGLVMDPEMLLMDANNDDRRRVAMRYLRGLSNTALTLPVTRDWAEPVWQLFVVWSGERNTLRWRLSSQGIEMLIHYPTPPHQQADYLGGVPGGGALAEALAAEALSLRIWPGTAEADVDQGITPCLATS